ncbi:MAG: hemolysin family protein [Rhodothermales bacterium]
MTIALIVLMIVLSAFFSGSEIAFVTANRLRAEVRAHREGFVGNVVREFIREPARFLTTTLVGNNVALVLYSALMALYLDPLLRSSLLGLLGPETPVEGLVLILQTIIASTVILIFGEIIPKSLFREPADQVVFACAVPLKVTYWLFLPIIKVAGWTSSLLVRLTGVEAQTFQQFLRSDYEAVVRESRESGTLDLDEEESEILSNVFELRHLRVKDSMVPRTDVEGIEEGATMAEAQARFVETGFSRLPVYRENIDRIVGVVVAHDLFLRPAKLSDITRDVPFVPESKRAKDLLYEFLAKGTSMAVVIDEYGGTAGLISVEDLLEELFGDIRDEFDEEEEGVRRVDEHTLLVSGRTEVHTLVEDYGLTLDEGDYDTIAGLLLDRLSSIPQEREEFELDGYRFTILKATANRIDTLRIVRETPGRLDPGGTPPISG